MRTVFITELNEALAKHFEKDRCHINSVELLVDGVPRSIPIGKGRRLTLEVNTWNTEDKAE